MEPMDYQSILKAALAAFGSSKEDDGELDKLDIPKQREPAPTVPSTWLTYTDRLYLASYTTPPTADTLFPYPDPPHSRRSPSKRSARAAEGPSAVLSEKDRSPPCYFSIDDTLLYNAFHHDFGPLHIGHLYRFAVQFHDILGAPENKNRPVVFWSKADARSKYLKYRFERDQS
jgi:cell division cycle 14